MVYAGCAVYGGAAMLPAFGMFNADAVGRGLALSAGSSV